MSGITGGDQLEGLGRRLEAAGDDLRKELQAGFRSVAPSLIQAAKANARERLPKAGGLNARVANDAFVVEDRSLLGNVGIRIGTAVTDARGSNKGKIRHPVFGHMDRWVTQRFTPGKDWFFDAMYANQSKSRAAVSAAIDAVAAKVTRGA